MKRFSKRILCIDDNKETCELTTLMLDNAGYGVTTVGTMSNALSTLKKEKFHLIIPDTQFRDGNGIDLCSQIRSRDPKTSIVFHSADARQTKVADAVSAGANHYLFKPTGWFTLIETVNRLS